MNRQCYQTPPRWWEPKLSRFWVRLWRPIRYWQQRHVQRVEQIVVLGQAHLRRALDDGCGVLLTPNHPSHADSYLLYHAADLVGTPLYFMTAWQVFQMCSRLEQRILQQHGCFSVDRESNDLRAFRTAVGLLQRAPEPLVIFPEGEVYHQNERVTPLRDGALRIACSAARRADRPIVCVPCALRLWYTQDPTPALLDLMDRLETSIFWRPCPDRPLAERIYRFAEAALALKEIEYLGHTSGGPLPDRLDRLREHILHQMEMRHQIRSPAASVPERVKELRRRAIAQLAKPELPDRDRQRFQADLEDLFLVIQLYSYPGDYVAERPSIERIAETLDKFEEDVLQAPTATVRGVRHASVRFGEPIRIKAVGRGKEEEQLCHELTREVQRRIQALLDEGAGDKQRFCSAGAVGRPSVAPQSEGAAR